MEAQCVLFWTSLSVCVQKHLATDAVSALHLTVLEMASYLKNGSSSGTKNY
jgi:hypothetical protein